MPDFNGQRLYNIADPVYDKDGVSLRFLNFQLSGLNISNFVKYSGSTNDLNLSGQSLFTSNLSILSSNTPSGSTDTGSVGEIRWDSNYIYVAISTNTWVRTPLSSW